MGIRALAACLQLELFRVYMMKDGSLAANLPESCHYGMPPGLRGLLYRPFYIKPHPRHAERQAC